MLWKVLGVPKAATTKFGEKFRIRCSATLLVRSRVMSFHVIAMAHALLFFGVCSIVWHVASLVVYSTPRRIQHQAEPAMTCCGKLRQMLWPCGTHYPREVQYPLGILLTWDAIST